MVGCHIASHHYRMTCGGYQELLQALIDILITTMLLLCMCLFRVARVALV